MCEQYQVVQAIACDVGNLAHTWFKLLTVTTAEHACFKDFECKRVQQALGLTEGEDIRRRPGPPRRYSHRR